MSGIADSFFSVNVQPRAARMCVVVAGELDLATAGRIEPEVLALIDAGCAVVEIDLRALEFIDSSGIHELLRCNALAAARAVPLRLLLEPGPVLRALTVSAVLEQFEAVVAG